MKLIGVFLGALVIVLVGISYDQVSVAEKINGVSLVSPHKPSRPEIFKPVKEIPSNWVALIPFAFCHEGEPSLRFSNRNSRWWGEGVDGVSTLVTHAHQNFCKVMIKPHVWVSGQGWPGEYDLETEADWRIWEQDYRKYILAHASAADSLNVGMFCIGTEHRMAAKERPEYWSNLIDDVRKVYRGNLIYAANWDNYMNVTFWDKLDYIGIDAYFPLTEIEDPSLQEIKKGWEPIRKDLKSFSRQYGKPILFTEYGYQSTTGTAGKHWEVDDTIVNLEAQALAYQALFEMFWDEKWFAGGFFWKWFPSGQVGGPGDSDFTPQGKPALKVISDWYSG